MNRRLFHGQLADEIAGEDRIRAERLRLLARSLVDILREALARDGMVRVHGFGTFRLKRMAARRGINPQTGEPIEIPARNRVIFRPAKALRERVEPGHPPAVPLAEPHESREAWLGGRMADAPAAGVLPAADDQRSERSYFPDRVAAASMPERTARVTASAHPVEPRGSGSREASLGGAMADSPTAGRVVLGATGESGSGPADAAGAANDEGSGARAGADAARGGAGDRQPERPGGTPATPEAPEREWWDVEPPPEPDRGTGPEDTAGDAATRVPAAADLPEAGEPGVARTAGRSPGAPEPSRRADIPVLDDTADEPPPEAEPQREETGRRPAMALVALILLVLLLGLLGWWLWPVERPGTVTATDGAGEAVEAPDSGATAADAGEGATGAAAPEPQADAAAGEAAGQAGTAADADTGTPGAADAEEVAAGDAGADAAGTGSTQAAEPAAGAAAGEPAADGESARAEAAATGSSGTQTAADGGAAGAAAGEGTAGAGGETTAAAAPETTTAAATATPSAAETPWFAAREYAVQRGDTLWDLSDRNYVNPYYWPHIWNHNESLADPDRIEIDQVLWLPRLEGEPRNLTAADRRSIAEGYLRLYRHWVATGAGNPQYALVGVRYFDPGVMPPELRNDPAAGRPNDALAAAFAALLEAEFPIRE